MADASTTVFIDVQPLVTSDGAALTSDIVPKGFWQPNYVLRSKPEELVSLSGSLAATGDVWRVMIAPPTPMRDYIFLPIALNASFALGTIGSPFWETSALYSIVPPLGTVPLRHAWRSFDLDAVRTSFNGGDNVRYQTASPSFQGYPPSPVPAQATGIQALGGFQFTIDTFDAAELAAMRLSIDARWLAFPVAVGRSAGYYAGRQFFVPA